MRFLGTEKCNAGFFMLISQNLPLWYLFNMIKVDILRVFLFSITFNLFKFFFND